MKLYECYFSAWNLRKQPGKDLIILEIKLFLPESYLGYWEVDIK